MIKKGTRVHFRWVGFTYYGIVDEPNERLTDLNGLQYYWMVDEHTGVRYPVKEKDIVRFL